MDQPKPADTSKKECRVLDSGDNLRYCPECGLESIKGMPGGRDATCINCGYKDPCCYD